MCSKPVSVVAERMLLSLASIPLDRDRHAKLITYQSAIALKFSHTWGTPVIPLAECIALHIRSIQISIDAVNPAHPVHSLSDPNISLFLPRPQIEDAEAQSISLTPIFMVFLSNLEISVQPSGHIQFKCSAKAIEVWLQAILDESLMLLFLPQPRANSRSNDFKDAYENALPQASNQGLNVALKNALKKIESYPRYHSVRDLVCPRPLLFTATNGPSIGANYIVFLLELTRSCGDDSSMDDYNSNDCVLGSAFSSGLSGQGCSPYIIFISSAWGDRLSFADFHS
ncbi:MAG: hypothetical protein F6K16_36840 [Symploca sp. SIO2B6]|nr:hypothetical protein [Symploca sp. SIO2B6]